MSAPLTTAGEAFKVQVVLRSKVCLAFFLLTSCDAEVVRPLPTGGGGAGVGAAGTSQTGGGGSGLGGNAGGGGFAGGGGSGMAGAGGLGGAGGATGGFGGGGNAAGGAGGGITGPIAVGEVVPDFGLLDVNTASPTSGTVVSPRDYLEQVSGWYFGHAT